MINSYKKFPLAIRIISLILVVTFLAQDIVWANPDVYRNLAVTGLKNPEVLARLRASLIIKLIEERSILLKGGLDSLKLDDILKWERSTRKEFKNVKFEALRDSGKLKEVRLSIEKEGLTIRYYDSGSSGLIQREILKTNLPTPLKYSLDGYKHKSKLSDAPVRQSAVGEADGTASPAPVEDIKPPSWAKGLRIYYAFSRNSARPGKDRSVFGDFTDMKYVVKHAKDLGFNAVFTLPLCDPSVEADIKADSPYSLLSSYGLDPRNIDWEATGLKGTTLYEKWQYFTRDASAIPQGYISYVSDDRFSRYAEIKALRIARDGTQGYPLSGVFADSGGITDDEIKSTNEYTLTRSIILMEQFYARQQLIEVIKYAHEIDMKIGVDKPFFETMEGVDAKYNRKIFVQDGEGRIEPAGNNVDSPDPNLRQFWGSKETQKGLARYNWEELKKQDYEPIIAPIRYFVEELGFDFVRGDAFHYGYGQEGLYEKVAEVCRKNKALFIPETLGCWNETIVNGACQRLGMMPINNLIFREWGAEKNFTDKWRWVARYFTERSRLPEIWMPTHHDSLRIMYEYDGLFSRETLLETRARIMHLIYGLALPNYSVLYGDEFFEEEAIQHPGHASDWKHPSPFHNELANTLISNLNRLYPDFFPKPQHDLSGLLSNINKIRQACPYLGENGNIHFISASDKEIVFARYSPDGKKALICMINPNHMTMEGKADIKLHQLGVDLNKGLTVKDMLNDEELRFNKENGTLFPDGSVYYKLEPGACHVFEVDINKERAVAARHRDGLRRFFFNDNGLPGIHAGYPHFGDQEWGRDTHITMLGVLSDDNLIEEARDMLIKWAALEDNGSLPNVSSWGGGAGNYNTSDAPLWFINAVAEYINRNGHDADILEERVNDQGKTVRDALRNIMRKYSRPKDQVTDWNEARSVHMDQNTGFVWVPKQSTWMDTKFTERQGYAVEIQALWYNANRVMAELDHENTSAYNETNQKLKSNFLKFFWNKHENTVYDLLGTNGAQSPWDALPDPAVTCNQIFAAYFGLVDNGSPEMKAMLESTKTRLLLPGSLRSQAAPTKIYENLERRPDGVNEWKTARLPGENEKACWPYREHYDSYQGDPSYHRGVAWGWPNPFYWVTAVREGTETKEIALSALRSDSLHLMQDHRTGGSFLYGGSLPELTNPYVNVLKDAEGKDYLYAYPIEAMCGEQAWSVGCSGWAIRQIGGDEGFERSQFPLSVEKKKWYILRSLAKPGVHIISSINNDPTNFVSRINEIRETHPYLQGSGNIEFISNTWQELIFARYSPDEKKVLICIFNPTYETRSGKADLKLHQLGVDLNKGTGMAFYDLFNNRYIQLDRRHGNLLPDGSIFYQLPPGGCHIFEVEVDREKAVISRLHDAMRDGDQSERSAMISHLVYMNRTYRISNMNDVLKEWAAKLSTAATTADAPLWLFELVSQHIELNGGNRSVLDEKVSEEAGTLRDCLRKIIDNYYRTNSDAGIHTNPDIGFIWVPKGMTWMGPERQGYPVEIQALMYNADLVMSKLDPENAGKYGAHAEKFERYFHEYFWNPNENTVYDILGTDGVKPPWQAIPDPAVRPNQIFAVYFGLVKGDRAQDVLRSTRNRLLLPGALRDLAEPRLIYEKLEWPENQLPKWNARTPNSDSGEKPSWPFDTDSTYKGMGCGWLNPFFWVTAVREGEAAARGEAYLAIIYDSLRLLRNPEMGGTFLYGGRLPELTTSVVESGVEPNGDGYPFVRPVNLLTERSWSAATTIWGLDKLISVRSSSTGAVDKNEVVEAEPAQKLQNAFGYTAFAITGLSAAIFGFLTGAILFIAHFEGSSIPDIIASIVNACLGIPCVVIPGAIGGALFGAAVGGVVSLVIYTFVILPLNTVRRISKIGASDKPAKIKITVTKAPQNPILEPISGAGHEWEKDHVLNPGVFYYKGRYYLLYRAHGEGPDRIGLAISDDGVTITQRLDGWILAPDEGMAEENGCEDPRVTIIDDTLCLAYTAVTKRGEKQFFQPAVASMPISQFMSNVENPQSASWKWEKALTFEDNHTLDKNAALFPEKIKGRYAMLHRQISDKGKYRGIQIAYSDKVKGPYAGTQEILKARRGKWDSHHIGVAAPPMKTEAGWLLLYHGAEKISKGVYIYRLGYAILDINDPTKVLYRSEEPLIEPTEDYERHGRPGEKAWIENVVFPCGSVRKGGGDLLRSGDTIFIYYGGADHAIAQAKGVFETSTQSKAAPRRSSSGAGEAAGELLFEARKRSGDIQETVNEMSAILDARSAAFDSTLDEIKLRIKIERLRDSASFLRQMLDRIKNKARDSKSIFHVVSSCLFHVGIIERKVRTFEITRSDHIAAGKDIINTMSASVGQIRGILNRFEDITRYVGLLDSYEAELRSGVEGPIARYISSDSPELRVPENNTALLKFLGDRKYVATKLPEQNAIIVNGIITMIRQPKPMNAARASSSGTSDETAAAKRWILKMLDAATIWIDFSKRDVGIDSTESHARNLLYEIVANGGNAGIYRLRVLQELSPDEVSGDTMKRLLDATQNASRSFNIGDYHDPLEGMIEESVQPADLERANLWGIFEEYESQKLSRKNDIQLTPNLLPGVYNVLNDRKDRLKRCANGLEAMSAESVASVARRVYEAREDLRAALRHTDVNFAQAAIGRYDEIVRKIEDEILSVVPQNQHSSSSGANDKPAELREETIPPSILEAAEINIRKAAQTMDMDPKLLDLILKPKRVTPVKFEVLMDSGEYETFHAFRALQNDALGPGKGGLRWLVGRGETVEEAQKTAVGLATLMSVKNAVIGIPYGGAKGDVFVKPIKYSLNEKARIFRGFSRELTKKHAIGTFIDVPAPDMGTGGQMMGWFLDEHIKTLAEMGEIHDKTIEKQIKKVIPSANPKRTSYLNRYAKLLEADKAGILQGFELGMVTGKLAGEKYGMIGKGGSQGRTKATGFGGFLALDFMLKRFKNMPDIKEDFIGKDLNDTVRQTLKKDYNQMTAAVQGTGNVGEYHAWELYRRGVKITLLEDAVDEEDGFNTYTLYNPNGINLDLLNEEGLKRLEDGRWANLKTLTQEFLNKTGCQLLRNNKSIFWETHTNIKVPAATQKTITAENVGIINCEIILELANYPTTPVADEYLKKRGILVIPDVLANVGGVTVSYYEWLQNIEGKYWRESTVDKMLEERINIESRMVLEFSRKFGVGLREAAFILYLTRVANATIARSDELAAEFKTKKPYKYYGELGLFPATMEELNRLVKDDEFGKMQERADVAKSAEIDDVVERVTKKFTSDQTSFVLISGPTTSGKLGLAVDLTDRFNAQGKGAIRLNFDKLTPDDLRKLKDGEEIEAKDEIGGKEVTRRIVPRKGDIFVIEGNYTLSDEVMHIIPRENRFGIFVNTAPSMKLADNWPLMSLDLRLLRHILTVHHTEGVKAIDVIRRWPSERQDQLDHVYPDWVNADITFNGYLPYELPLIKFCVKDMIEEALDEARRDKDEASMKIIDRLKRTLKNVTDVDPNKFKPKSSSVLQYLGTDGFYDKLAQEVAPAISGDRSSSSGENDESLLSFLRLCGSDDKVVRDEARTVLDGLVKDEAEARKAASVNGKLKRPEPGIRPAAERVKDTEEVNQGFSIMDALIEASRCMQCKKPLCQHGAEKKDEGGKVIAIVGGCPVNLKIKEFVAAFRQGDIKKAYEIIKGDNSLPAITSRVCPQESQCQLTCLLGKKGEPIAIGLLERMVTDLYEKLYGQESRESAIQIKKMPPEKDHPVAIIGCGPAGLTTAADLAKLGYSNVYIFEALHEPGGVLTYGIPPFRLPREIIRKDIEDVKHLGVHIMTDVVIGRTLKVEDLEDMGFKTFFLGTGAGLPVFMGIPGEELNGVVSANEFLTRCNLMHAAKPGYDTLVKTGDKVVVVGGGNVAMDAARWAKRLGANVTVVYRRTKEEMPARKEEIEHAVEEGIKFEFLVAPTRLLGENGDLKKVECQRMQLGEADSSGRRRPIAVKGSEFIMDGVTTVIEALGNEPNTMIMDQTEGLETTKKRTVKIGAESTGQTTRPDIFAGGDVATGAATVISAMGAGKKAAIGIHDYLQKIEERARKIAAGNRFLEAGSYEILSHRNFGNGIVEMEVRAPLIANTAKAGQFVMVMANEKAERIPLTLADWNKEKGTITLAVQEVGVSTYKLGALNAGEKLFSVVGPLGRPSDVENLGPGKNVVMIAGGIGTAPAYPIAREHKKIGNHVISVIGARDENRLFWKDRMSDVSDELYVTFDSKNRLVTDALREILENRKKRESISHIMAIGPPIMMQKVYELASKYDIKVIVSLNPIMLDGTGMCGGCRIPTSDGPKHACVDGPEFDASKIDWVAFRARQLNYREEEKAALRSSSSGADEIITFIDTILDGRNIEVKRLEKIKQYSVIIHGKLKYIVDVPDNRDAKDDFTADVEVKMIAADNSAIRMVLPRSNSCYKKVIRNLDILSFAPKFDIKTPPEELLPIKEISAALKSMGMPAQFEIKAFKSPAGDVMVVSLLLQPQGTELASVKIRHANSIYFHKESRPSLPDFARDIVWNETSYDSESEPENAEEEFTRTYYNLNPMATITHFELAPYLRDQGIGEAWYRTYIEPYLLKCGFNVVAALGTCLDSEEVEKFWRRQGFSERFSLNTLYTADTIREFVALKKISPTTSQPLRSSSSGEAQTAGETEPQYKVVVLCNQNKERSPIVADILCSMVPPDLAGKIEVCSAATDEIDYSDTGTDVYPGQEPILDNHFRRQVTGEEIREALIVFVMTENRRAKLMKQYPDYADKIQLVLGAGELKIYEDERPIAGRWFAPPRRPYWRMKQTVQANLDNIFAQIREAIEKKEKIGGDTQRESSSGTSDTVTNAGMTALRKSAEHAVKPLALDPAHSHGIDYFSIIKAAILNNSDLNIQRVIADRVLINRSAEDDRRGGYITRDRYLNMPPEARLTPVEMEHFVKELAAFAEDSSNDPFHRFRAYMILYAIYHEERFVETCVDADNSKAKGYLDKAMGPDGVQAKGVRRLLENVLAGGLPAPQNLEGYHLRLLPALADKTIISKSGIRGMLYSGIGNDHVNLARQTGADCVNVTMEIKNDHTDGRYDFPVRAAVKLINEPVIRLSSINGSFKVESKIDSLSEVYDYGRDQIFAVHKAALVASGIIPESFKDNPDITLRDILSRFTGREVQGIEISVESIGLPQQSGMGISSAVGVNIISALTKLSGQTSSDSPDMTRDDIMQCVARTLYVEQLTGALGGWQDACSMLPGIKLLHTEKDQFLPDYRRIDPAMQKGVEKTVKFVWGGLKRSALSGSAWQFTGLYALRLEPIVKARTRARQITREQAALIEAGKIAELAKLEEEKNRLWFVVAPAAYNEYFWRLRYELSRRLGAEALVLGACGSTYGAGNKTIINPDAVVPDGMPNAGRKVSDVFDETFIDAAKTVQARLRSNAHYDSYEFSDVEPSVYDYKISDRGYEISIEETPKPQDQHVSSSGKRDEPAKPDNSSPDISGWQELAALLKEYKEFLLFHQSLLDVTSGETNEYFEKMDGFDKRLQDLRRRKVRPFADLGLCYVIGSLHGLIVQNKTAVRAVAANYLNISQMFDVELSEIPDYIRRINEPDKAQPVLKEIAQISQASLASISLEYAGFFINQGMGSTATELIDRISRFNYDMEELGSRTVTSRGDLSGWAESYESYTRDALSITADFFKRGFSKGIANDIQAIEALESQAAAYLAEPPASRGSSSGENDKSAVFSMHVSTFVPALFLAAKAGYINANTNQDPDDMIKEIFAGQRVLVIALEEEDPTTSRGFLNRTNVVTYLRSLGIDAVGLDPKAEDDPNLGYVKGFVQSMPFSENEFDAAISVDFFDELYLSLVCRYQGMTEETFNSQVAAEVSRVLKDKGKFFIIDSNIKTEEALEKQGFDKVVLGHGKGSWWRNCILTNNKESATPDPTAQDLRTSSSGASDRMAGLEKKPKKYTHDMIFKVRRGESLVSQNGLKVEIREINAGAGFVSLETSWSKSDEVINRNLALRHFIPIGYGMHARVDRIQGDNAARITVRTAPSVIFENSRAQQRGSASGAEVTPKILPVEEKALPVKALNVAGAPIAEPFTSAEQAGVTLVNSTQGQVKNIFTDLHDLIRQNTASHPIPSNAKILLSATLFDEMDLEHLKGLLGENSLVAIASPKDIRRASINRKASKENLVCVIKTEDYDNKELWNKNHKDQNNATLIVLNEDLRGSRYLYLEGVVGLSRALMSNDTARARMYLGILFSKTDIGKDVDDASLLKYLLDDPRRFADLIRFKPIVPFESEELLRDYKTRVENFLIAA